jgi:hypothetical protein
MAAFGWGDSGPIKRYIFSLLVKPRWAYYVVGFEADQVMSVKLDPHNRLKGSLNLLMALVVVLIMLLLFLRMVTLVAGHHHL